MPVQTVLKSAPPRRPEMLKRSLPAIATGLLLLAILYATSLYSYLLFHTLAELMSITVNGAIFVLIWNTRQRIDNQYVLFIGLSMVFPAALDMVHALAYSGMPIFVGYDANLPTQLWIAARYLQSLSLLAGLFFLKRNVPIGPVMAAYGAVTTLLLAAIFARVFPDCYIAGSGLTAFKQISEYVIVIILLVAAVGLWQARSGLDTHLVRLLVLANVFTIGSELAFTTYISVYGPSNLVGHLLRLVSVGLYYRAIVRGGLMRPLEVLHRSLNQSEARFRSYFELPLTGRAITAPSQTWLEMNSTLCDLLGYTPAELRKMTWTQLTHPDDLAPDLEQFERVLAGEIDGFTLEKRFIRKDGQIIYTELATQCLRRPDRSVDYFVTLVQDITERKRAEVALLENRTNLSALIENTDGSIWAVDSQYRLIVGNALFHRNVAAPLGRGLSAGESVLLPQFPPDANADWQGYYDRALQGERFSVETLTRFKATPEYTEYRFSPIMSDGGRITGVTVFGLNITERKHAEEALRDSQARLQRAESVAHFGNWSFNLNVRLVYASAGARSIYGLQGETWSMAEVQSIPLPEYRATLDAALKNLIEHQQPYNFEFRIRRPTDGQLRDIHSIAEYDPVRHIVFGVIQDITDRKQIESQLQISLTKYQTLFETLPVGITIADRSGQITE
ncbi:MAG: PAS domain S-box protein, partial [Thermoflexales bacterium]|nr:PAS domain S-box protein [Thermoflexales bacterium]